MLPEKYKALSDEQTIPLIEKAKKKLGDKVLILGHHYQRDEVVRFADEVGDSLNLSKKAAESKSPYIIFCGVRFMAETADIVTDESKIVILPDLSAGCPMADMAPVYQIEKAWKELSQIIDIKDVIPITYINSSAETKAFCGNNNGLVCTSSNAEKIIKWVFDKNKRIFFFPDRYLSTNLALKIGLNKSEIALWDRYKENGNLTDYKIRNARIFVWNGYCPVHSRFKTEDIDILRKQNQNIKIIVHPEVPEQVALKADYMGSTNFIVKTIQESEPGSEWGIGTEIHLVSRLSKQNPDKKIHLIGTPICMCSMMDRISPQYLLWILESLIDGKIENQIKVPEDIKKSALIALNSMFELS
jgi:quinolinate synthase